MGYLASVESRYQAFIASINRINFSCVELDLVLTVHATTIIIAFGRREHGGGRRRARIGGATEGVSKVE